MLPTPCTSHVSFDTIYEPSEDTYLFLDTLSSPGESAWLSQRFNTATSNNESKDAAAPLVVEVGTGSGVVLAFVAANAQHIVGRRDILSLGTDVNRNACAATRETANKAIYERQADASTGTGSAAKTPFLASLATDLLSPLRPGTVDVLLFNPPYVPTDEIPDISKVSQQQQDQHTPSELSRTAKFEQDSYFLSLTYAGGLDGMQITDRLLDAIPDVLSPTRGVAYVLLCKQNRPEMVMQRIRGWDGGNVWRVEVVGNSGRQAGWEKLVIVRVWRVATE